MSKKDMKMKIKLDNTHWPFKHKFAYFHPLRASGHLANMPPLLKIMIYVRLIY